MAKEDQPQVTPERLMQFGFAYAPPLIIGAKVFDTLTRGPKSVDEVSRETGASTRGLRAIMNAGRLRHLQLQSNQELARRSRIQRRADPRGAGAVATCAGNKILAIVDGLPTIPNKTVML